MSVQLTIKIGKFCRRCHCEGPIRPPFPGLGGKGALDPGFRSCLAPPRATVLRPYRGCASNARYQKESYLCIVLVLVFSDLEHWNLFRISCFGFRIWLRLCRAGLQSYAPPGPIRNSTQRYLVSFFIGVNLSNLWTTKIVSSSEAIRPICGRVLVAASPPAAPTPAARLIPDATSWSITIRSTPSVTATAKTTTRRSENPRVILVLANAPRGPAIRSPKSAIGNTPLNRQKRKGVHPRLPPVSSLQLPAYYKYNSLYSIHL